MVPLIARTRLRIADPEGSAQVWGDQDIQDILDDGREDIRLLPLTNRLTLAAGSTAQYLEYYADWGDWEDDVLLQDPAYAPLTPDVSDTLTGHWTLAVSTYPPVWLTGKTYDVYRAAADLLEMRAAALTGAYDFQVDGQRFQRSQQGTALLTLAKQYRAKQRVRVGRLERDDIRRHQQFPRMGRLIPRVYE